jgi:ribosomal protein L10
VEDDIFIDNDVFLVIDFVNLKIKSAQSFRDAHRDNVSIYIYKDEILRHG